MSPKDIEGEEGRSPLGALFSVLLLGLPGIVEDAEAGVRGSIAILVWNGVVEGVGGGLGDLVTSGGSAVGDCEVC